MGKKNDKSLSEKLIADGTLTLTADSREAIYKDGETVVAGLPPGTKWTRSIVCFDGYSVFNQTYQILK
jgi:hypothetical protein